MWQETHRSKLRATGQSRRQLFSLPLHFLLQNRQDLILHFYREPFKTSRKNPNDRNDTKATRYHCTLTLKQKWVGDLELFSRCQEMMEGTRRYALKGLQCDISVHSFFFGGLLWKHELNHTQLYNLERKIFTCALLPFSHNSESSS